jgi:hypothetical protein
LTQCSIYRSIFKAQSKRFSAEDIVILDRTIAEIGYVRGFNADLKIDYIISTQLSERNLPRREPQIVAILRGYSPEAIMSFFENIYSLKIETTNLITKKEKAKKWKDYTYLSKHLYPPLEIYVEFMERCIIRTNRDFTPKILSIKESIDAKLVQK